MRKKLKDRVLAEGEATGHAHRIQTDVYDVGNGVREFQGPTAVTHQEHRRLKVPKGSFCSAQIREYDHFTEEARTVQD